MPEDDATRMWGRKDHMQSPGGFSQRETQLRCHKQREDQTDRQAQRFCSVPQQILSLLLFFNSLVPLVSAVEKEVPL